MPAGRPSKYNPEFVEEARKLCLLGLKNSDLAKYFGVALKSIYRWQDEYPEFKQALKAGRENADTAVANALYKSACDGNVTAQIFWLKNRHYEFWRDVQKVEKTVKGDVRHTHESVSETAGWVDEMLGTPATNETEKPRTH